MAEFKDGWAFIRYQNIVSTQYRFAYPDEVREFLQVLVEASKSRIRLIPVGSFLFGGAGNDNVLGSYSDDTLVVGDGIDGLGGSEGNDRYIVTPYSTGITFLNFGSQPCQSARISLALAEFV